MKHFIVYNEEGKILRTGTCPPELLNSQATIGEFVIEGKANDKTEQIINKKIVPLPVKPNDYSVFDYGTQTWKESTSMKKEVTVKEASIALKSSLSSIIGLATQYEVDSWNKQEKEARGWLADNTYPTPFIDALIASPNKWTDKQLLCERIVEKADKFAASVGSLIGEYQAKIEEFEV